MSNSTVRLPSLLAASMGQDDTRGDVCGEANPVAAYRRVLQHLWLLDSPPAPSTAAQHQADVAEAQRLLPELARLCDDLGPAFAEAVGREAAREWVATWGRCPRCSRPSGHP